MPPLGVAASSLFLQEARPQGQAEKQQRKAEGWETLRAIFWGSHVQKWVWPEVKVGGAMNVNITYAQ